MIGLEGPTRMDKNEHVSIQGEAYWEDLGYSSKVHGTHQACPHSGWTWKEHMGSTKIKKSWNNQKNQHPSKFRGQNESCQTSAKTKVTAMPRSIDLKPPRTISYQQFN